MIRTDICYTACHLVNQTVTPTLTGFQILKLYIQYLNSHPHKPIFCPSNYYGESNVISIIWSGNKVEDYTTHKCLEFHQDVDCTRIINRRWSVSGIINTLLGIAAF